MFKTEMARLSSAMVTEYAAELVVEVTLQLHVEGENAKLVASNVRHLQETPSLAAIQQMHWELPLQPDWLEKTHAKKRKVYYLTAEGEEQVVAYYKECTRALFKRRPWMPDHKPYLSNILVLLPEEKKLPWVTTRRISTHTEEGLRPNWNLPPATGPAALDD